MIWLFVCSFLLIWWLNATNGSIAACMPSPCDLKVFRLQHRNPITIEMCEEKTKEIKRNHFDIDFLIPSIFMPLLKCLHILFCTSRPGKERERESKIDIARCIRSWKVDYKSFIDFFFFASFSLLFLSDACCLADSKKCPSRLCGKIFFLVAFKFLHNIVPWPSRHKMQFTTAPISRNARDSQKLTGFCFVLPIGSIRSSYHVQSSFTSHLLIVMCSAVHIFAIQFTIWLRHKTTEQLASKSIWNLQQKQRHFI